MLRVDVGWTTWLTLIVAIGGCGDDTGVDAGDGTDDTTATSETTATSATSASADTSSESSSSTTSSSSTSDGADSTSTTGFDFGACYDPQTHPWSGALCGSLATPCVVQLDERVDEHSDALAHGITLDDDCNPHVIYSHYGKSFDGFFASRSAAGDWSSVDMPGAVAGGAIAWDTEIDVLRLLAYDGAGTISQLLYDGDISELPGLSLDDGLYVLQARGAASLGHGTWHVGLKILSDSIAEDVTYARFDGDAWTRAAVGPGYIPSVAVTAADVAHLGYFQVGDTGFELAYLETGDAPTTIAGAGDGTYVALGLAGDIPHLFFEGVGAQPNERRIALASAARPNPRPDQWSVSTVAVSTDDGCAAPTFEGQTCELDYFVYRPLALVASGGGDIRLLYGEDHHLGSLLAECDDMTGCEWTTEADEIEALTWIAAPRGDAFEASVLLERRAVAVDAAIDGAGTMHLVVTTETDGVATIDYVRLGG